MKRMKKHHDHHSSDSTMVALFLTPAEQKLLEKTYKGKYVVQPEMLTFEDTEEKLASRVRGLRVTHPVLKQLRKDSLKEDFTAKEVKDLYETADLSGLSKEDFAELAFVWGPNVFTLMIARALPLVKSEEDLQTLTVLAHMRHGLLLAFNS